MSREASPSGASLVLVGPLMTKVAVDLFFAPGPAQPVQGFTLWVRSVMEGFGFGASPYRGVIFISLVFLLANFSTLFMQYTQDAVLRLTGQRIIFDLRQQIFAHLHRLPIEFFDRNPVGRLMTRLTTDVDALDELFAAGVVGVLSNFAILFFILGWMLWVNWRLSLVTFSILPLLVALVVWIRVFSRKAFRDTRIYMARINAFLQERLMGMGVVHLFTREAQELAKFREINGANRDANLRTVFYSSVFSPAVEIIGATGIALIIWYGGGHVISGAATLGTLVAFIQLSKSFYDPISTISERYRTLQEALAASERIFALLDEPAAGGPQRPAGIGRAAGRIEFRNVWFAYRGEDWVLKDVSFSINSGERVAVVGHTGAGKTTITNLLLKLYDPQRGQILLDGVDIRHVAADELRANLGVVLQDVFLFSGDIESNIRFGDAAVTDAKMREAAREANADFFINRLPDGFASKVGERGGGLSVGQKQLISFARALASDPSILVLDEATSSVDTGAEELIHQAIERLMIGRTSLVIAHRLSTIQKVDKIIVLHKGAVREVGRRHDLLAERGLYWRLYRLQFDHDIGRAVVGAVGD